MGWFFSKKAEPPGRKEFRAEFESVTSRLRNADEATQVAVGHCINLAHSFFAQRFGDTKSFRALSADQKHSYIESLTAMEEKMLQKDPHAGLGFGLFKMWIGAVTANDEELVKEFSDTLAFFSRKGNLGG
jgi:hypothetical protein